jgi:hypothetical protein
MTNLLEIKSNLESNIRLRSEEAQANTALAFLESTAKHKEVLAWEKALDSTNNQMTEKPSQQYCQKCS